MAEENAASTLSELKAAAQRLGRAAFVERHARGFLIHRPSRPSAQAARHATFDDDDDEADGAGAGQASTLKFGFRTSMIERDALAMDLLDDELLDETGWLVLPLAKRAGNPYPDRLGIGRARNCDLVLRWPTVSKLHAHLHLANGAIARITDLRSANGTQVNGAPVGPEGAAVDLKSRLRIGTLECELAAALPVYYILAAL